MVRIRALLVSMLIFGGVSPAFGASGNITIDSPIGSPVFPASTTSFNVSGTYMITADDQPKTTSVGPTDYVGPEDSCL